MSSSSNSSPTDLPPTLDGLVEEYLNGSDDQDQDLEPEPVSRSSSSEEQLIPAKDRQKDEEHEIISRRDVRPEDLVCYRGLNFAKNNKLLISCVLTGIALLTSIIWLIVAVVPLYKSSQSNCESKFLGPFLYAVGLIEISWIFARWDSRKMTDWSINDRPRYKRKVYQVVLLGLGYYTIKNTGLIILLTIIRDRLDTCDMNDPKIIAPAILTMGGATALICGIGALILVGISIYQVCKFIWKHPVVSTSFFLAPGTTALGIYLGTEFMHYTELAEVYYGLRFSMLIYTYLNFMVCDFIVVMFDPIFVRNNMYQKFKDKYPNTVDYPNEISDQRLLHLVSTTCYSITIKNLLICLLLFTYVKLEESGNYMYLFYLLCSVSLITSIWSLRYITIYSLKGLKWCWNQCCKMPYYAWRNARNPHQDPYEDL